MADRQPGRRQGRRGRGGLALGMRDMLLSMVVLAAVVLVVLGVRGGWSLSPGAASVDSGSVPAHDARGQLRAAAGSADFGVRSPAVPRGWRSNSGDTVRVAGSRAVRTGWVTGTGGFVRLVQSDAPAAALAAHAAQRPGRRVAPVGSARAGGVRWTVYPAVRSERSWVWDAGTARLLITGNAGPARFRALARAVHAAPPR